MGLAAERCSDVRVNDSMKQHSKTQCAGGTCVFITHKHTGIVGRITGQGIISVVCWEEESVRFKTKTTDYFIRFFLKDQLKELLLIPLLYIINFSM